MRHGIITAAFSLLAGPVLAQSAPTSGDAKTIGIAQAYLEAYQALDIERLGDFYAEDAEFNDPTSLEVKGIPEPFVWRGRTKVLAGLGQWVATVQSIRYDVDRVYEASGHVVFVGGVTPMMKSANGGANYRFPIVTIVSIKDGLVVEHRDYTDYAGAVLAPDQ